MLRDGFRETIQYLKEAYKAASEGLLTGACNDRARGNNFERDQS